jgi:predicted transposase YdaD
MLGYNDIELKQTRFYQDIFAEAYQEGFHQVEVTIILILLKHQLGLLSSETTNRIQQLGSEQLESLCDNLLDFTAINDLNTWLEKPLRQNNNSALKTPYSKHLI